MAHYNAGIYRREGWEVPLGAALLELRECAARLKLTEVLDVPFITIPGSSKQASSCLCRLSSMLDLCRGYHRHPSTFG